MTRIVQPDRFHRPPNFGFVLLAVAVAAVARPALAQPCAIGYTSLSASPASLNFSAKPDFCKGEVARQDIRLIGGGNEAANVESVSWQPEIIRPPFYEGNSWAASSELQPTESKTGTIIFAPEKEGSFAGAMVIQYGYSQNALNKYRFCLENFHRDAIASKERLLNEAQQRGADFSALIMMETKAKLDAAAQARSLEKERYEAQAKMESLIAEKEGALRDIRLGLYCSQCGNSKTEIEKRGEDFYAHLRRVKGDPVPADPHVIEETIKKYDGLIATAGRVVAVAAERVKEVERNLKERLYDLQVVKRGQVQAAFDRLVEQLKEEVRTAQSARQLTMNAYSRDYRDKRWWLRVSVNGECHEK